MLGHMVVLFLVFKGISILSSILAVSIYTPQNSARAFPFLHTISSTYCCRLFDDGHSDLFDDISHCSFDLHISKSLQIVIAAMKLKVKLNNFLLGRKVMTNLDSIFKSRDVALPTKVSLVKTMVFPVVMYGCESWTVKKAER